MLAHSELKEKKKKASTGREKRQSNLTKCLSRGYKYNRRAQVRDNKVLMFLKIRFEVVHNDMSLDV